MHAAASPVERFRQLRGAGIAWPRYTTEVVIALSALIAVWAAIQYSQSFMTGLIVGSLYALSAVGLTLIYSIARTPHFAHGDTMMMAAYFTFFALTGVVIGSKGDVVSPIRIDRLPGATDQIWRFSFGYGFLLACVVSAILSIPVLLLINRFIYRPLLGRGSGSAIIAVASLGVAIALRGLILLIWGATPRKYSTGIRDTVQVWKLPRVVADQYFILVVALVLTILVSWLLFRTKLGTSMRAMADNPDLARASGIVAADVTRWTWIIAGVLITAAGTLLALQSQLSADLGFVLLLPIFAAAIFGGVGSPQGAFLGGLIIGVVSEVTVATGLFSPGYKIAVAMVALILVILFRPSGLMGPK
ncbi:MAG: branched-chain amino acid ABC transporter permease [Thermomicrobiales bacterium]|nr:branched-chain amino acid ABC transporter permease [Thermomicrobiales bacterium]